MDLFRCGRQVANGAADKKDKGREWQGKKRDSEEGQKKSEITGEEEGTSADADAGVDAADVSPRKGTFL